MVERCEMVTLWPAMTALPTRSTPVSFGKIWNPIKPPPKPAKSCGTIHGSELASAVGGAWTETDAGSGIRPLVGVGLGERLLLTSNMALTARVGGEVYAERVYLNNNRSTHAMGFWSIALGLSFYLPGGAP